jgi:hypothetical protein
MVEAMSEQERYADQLKYGSLSTVELIASMRDSAEQEKRKVFAELLKKSEVKLVLTETLA